MRGERHLRKRNGRSRIKKKSLKKWIGFTLINYQVAGEHCSINEVGWKLASFGNKPIKEL